jgi:nicotinic acid mononucleotide adenylyltransferase
VSGQRRFIGWGYDSINPDEVKNCGTFDTPTAAHAAVLAEGLRLAEVETIEVRMSKEVRDGTIELAGGSVTADIVAESGGFVSIYEWSSKNPGAGNTVRALQELRQRFNAPIIVHGIGEDGSESAAYWRKMRQRGLVDELRDGEGKRVEVA